MIINGKEIKFFYSLWAKTESDNYILSHEKEAISKASLQLALTMNEAAIRAGMETERLTPKDFEMLPASDFEAISAEVMAQIEKDSKTTVNVKPKGKKTENE
jgi:hypothetical protein